MRRWNAQAIVQVLRFCDDKQVSMQVIKQHHPYTVIN